jgi:hypothetical protein
LTAGFLLAALRLPSPSAGTSAFGSRTTYFPPLRHHEEGADIRIFEDAEKRIRALVAEAVGYHQRMLVKNLHEARGVALWRDPLTLPH